MASLDDIVRAIQRDLSPQFEARLREALSAQERDWLVDELVRATLTANGMGATGDGADPTRARERNERMERVRELHLDEAAVRRFTAENEDRTREALIADDYLVPSVPAKGTDLIDDDGRTAKGRQLLEHAKDVLFALLFGDETTATRLDRTQPELLTVALPRAKAFALDFMQASTQLAAAGTWQDPENVSNDERADNVVIEVEFSDTADEVVGPAVVAALSLINNLEINEQVLYARMINVEESTLID